MDNFQKARIDLLVYGNNLIELEERFREGLIGEEVYQRQRIGLTKRLQEAIEKAKTHDVDQSLIEKYEQIVNPKFPERQLLGPKFYVDATPKKAIYFQGESIVFSIFVRNEGDQAGKFKIGIRISSHDKKEIIYKGKEDFWTLLQRGEEKRFETLIELPVDVITGHYDVAVICSKDETLNLKDYIWKENVFEIKSIAEMTFKERNMRLEFSGNPEAVFQIARNRLVYLPCLQTEEKKIDKIYLATSTFCIDKGQPERAFLRINLTAREVERGLLTLSIMCSSEQIINNLFDFIFETFYDIKEHMMIIEEKKIRIQSLQAQCRCGYLLNVNFEKAYQEIKCPKCNTMNEIKISK